MRNSQFGVAILALAIAVSMASTQLTRAQDARPTMVEMNTERSSITVGEDRVSFNLPLDSEFRSSSLGDKVAAQVLPADKSYLISIRTHLSKDPETTPLEASQLTYDAIRARYGRINPNTGKVIDSAAELARPAEWQLKTANLDMSRFYVSTPDQNSKLLVKGYTFFKSSSHRFVVVEMMTTAERFERARPDYEALTASIRVGDAGAESNERSAALQAGSAWLESLTSADLARAADGKERWYRLYRPSTSGADTDAQEIGYRSMRFWRGKRGELDPSKPRNQWRRIENEEGTLCHARVRVLSGDAVIDTEARYFVSDSRQTEGWSIRVASADGQGAKTWYRELAFRVQDDLTLQVDASGAARETLRPLIPGKPYLSQVERFLLPALLAQTGADGDLAFYCYDNASRNVMVRRDSVRGTGAATGPVTLTTQFGADGPQQVSTLRQDGEVIRTDVGAAQVWEPIDANRLLRIWRDKKLPTGPLK